jgi:hypothetical protein
MVTKYVQPSHADSHQTSPNAILSIIPFLYRDTYHNTKIQNNMANAVAARKPVVIVSDILSVKISSSKANPMGTAEVMLSSGHLNYLALFQTGDHALIWLTNGPEQFTKVSNSVLAGKATNDSMSGLKFVGKVQSVREIFTTSGDGQKTVRYMVTFKSFSELQSQFYYNPLLAAETSANGQRMDKLMGMSNDWFSFFSKTGVATIEALANMLIDSILGQGPSESFAIRAGQVNSPNGAYLVPTQLANYLGLKAQGLVKYSYILNTLFGVQNYVGSTLYTPVLEKMPKSTTKYNTPQRLPGEIVGIPDPFNNSTFWSMVKTFMNPSVNELYCTLKMNPAGRIMPFIIARQQPFTSKFFSEKYIPHTAFTTLPRWKINDKLILDYNFGVNDSTRFNFVQTYVQVYDDKNVQKSMQLQIQQKNYALDNLDVSRSGVRTLINYSTATISSSQITTINKWKNLIADFNINQNLKLTGSMTCAGIIEPICIGDNLELENKLFHIEGIVHAYAVSASGDKSFRTSLDLSNGVLVTGDYAFTETGFRDDLQATNLPGYTDAESYINEKPINSTTISTAEKIINKAKTKKAKLKQKVNKK